MTLNYCNIMASIGTTKTKEKRRKVNFLKMLYSYYLLVLNFKVKKKCVCTCVLVHMSTDALNRPEECFSPWSWLEALVSLQRWVLGINSRTLEECYAHLKIWACSSGYNIYSACVRLWVQFPNHNTVPWPARKDPSMYPRRVQEKRTRVGLGVIWLVGNDKCARR